MRTPPYVSTVADRHPAAARRAAAVLVWALSLGTTLVVHARVERTVFVFFWIAVLFAAWYAGLAAAIVAAVASVVAVDYYVLPPAHGFTAPSGSDLVTLAIFVAASALVSALAAAAARAQRELRLALAETEAANARLRTAAREAEVARADADATRGRVTAILDGLTDAVATFDEEWRCTYLNPSAHRGLSTLGRDGDSLLGRVVWDRLPEVAGSVFEHEARRARLEGSELEFEGELLGTGRWIECRAVPGADGTLTVFTRDITRRRERRAADQTAAERARRLLALSSGLSEARTPAEVAEVTFREGMAAVGADAGSLGIVTTAADGDARMQILHTAGYPTDVTERFRSFPLRAGRPLSDAILERAPRLLRSRSDWLAQYPEMAQATGDMGYEAFAAVPVVSGGRALAGISFSFRAPVAFDEATRTFLATVGEQCGLALARARAFESEAEARAFSAETLASIRDGFIALDRDFRFTYVNARAEELLRQAPGSMVGREVWELFPVLYDSPFGRALRHVAETRQPETLEAESSNPGVWLEGRLYPAGDGVTMFFQDVTERRRAQQASEFLAEASGLLNASLDFTGTLRTVADAAVPALGDWCAVDVVRDPDEPRWPPVLDRLAVVHRDPAMIALGRTLVERYPTDWDAATGMAAVLRDATPMFIPRVTDEMLAGGARDAEHLEIMRALRFSSIIAVPMVARGRTVGALTLCMTESGRQYVAADLALAEELAQRAATAVDNARLYRDAQRARREAEHANRAKGEFLSTMSHELRTPINALLGYTELMDAGIRGPVTEAQHEDLGRMRRSAKVLMSLVTDVLNFARVEAGRVEFRPADVPIAGALAELEAVVSPQMRAKRLTYVQQACDAGLAVRADPERLQQILTNLLTNAIKFTAEGGRVTVSCADGPDAARAGARTVRVRVEDTGRGIAPEELGRIFEPFVQVDRHLTHDSQQGVGLGLAIARDLARRMDGDLAAESEVGRGSAFTLTLPAAVPPRPAA